ncbi:MAG TPA: chemotaxis protein CheA [Bryobacteraceae bacterium]|nr:chemotaxis protein CheA [Bryobacteraceae bacterium]
MIDQYKQTFQDEARELVAELESALLELDERGDDPEVIGRAFRALHTIKGSGAMFGFDDIAGFTHGLETAFDRLRNGKLAATRDLINLSLAAGDQIKSMLDEAAGRGVADQRRSADILAELQQLTVTGSEPDGATPVLPESATNRPLRDWRIRFRPKAGVLVNGTNPLLLLRQLRDLGSLHIDLDTSAVPPLGEIEAERSYLAWNLVLRTAAAPEAIRDVFIFVEGDCELTIERQPELAADVGISEPPPKRILSNGSVAGSEASTSVRVSAGKLDQLVNLVGELVTVQARLSEFANGRGETEILEISEVVDRLTSALRENSMSIRMLPLKTTFERFRRLVRDLSLELHKDVELTIEGADTELDKTVIDQLNDPLVHLVRNSMDHGIETPEVRRAAGKRPSGTIHLSASHSGANVVIRVSDDGRGLDAEAVRARAVERGLIDASARISKSEILGLILAPGFSTAREITELSGRGVGLDVVRRSVEGLRGTIEIESEAGAGLAVTLRLPLTLAIIDGLLVRVGQAHFVLPLANSLECVELTQQDIRETHGRHIANVRGELIPYIRLSEYFQIERPQPDCEQIMIVDTEDGHYGFVVDQVLGDHKTVIKNLGRLYRNVQVISGATVLGSGALALILDPHRLVQKVVQSTSGKRQAARWSGAVAKQDSR